MTTIHPQQTINTLFPQRPFCLKMFAESIEEADRIGHGKWGVTHYGNDRVRLNVGSIVVCTLHVDSIWFALDKAWHGSSEYNFIDTKVPGEWTWTTKYDYVAVPSMSGLYRPSTSSRVHTQTWAKIKKMHFALIAKAASKYSKLRSPSKKVHSQDFMDELRKELGDPTIPNP
jgi:hypothetical protein